LSPPAISEFILAPSWSPISEFTAVPRPQQQCTVMVFISSTVRNMTKESQAALHYHAKKRTSSIPMLTVCHCDRQQLE